MATWLTPFSSIWASLARRPPRRVSGASGSRAWSRVAPATGRRSRAGSDVREAVGRCQGSVQGGVFAAWSSRLTRSARGADQALAVRPRASGVSVRVVVRYPGCLQLDDSAGCVVHLADGQAEPVPQEPEPLTARPGDRLFGALRLVLGGVGVVHGVPVPFGRYRLGEGGR